MCGIAGIVQYKAFYSREQLQARLLVMQSEIAHRGPDDQGTWLSDCGGAGLAHTRLSIIDLSAGAHQPMMSEDGRYIVTFNGEIYNFQALRQRLEAKGTRFRSQSDTEVLLQAYRAYGESCLELFDGMYAFAVFDTVSRELFCARDPFGEKPFYYAWINGAFHFSSELTALGSLEDFHKTTTPGAIGGYLMLQYFDDEQTIYSGAKKLLPGHCLRISPSGEVSVRSHFTFNPNPMSGQWDAESLADELEELLIRSLQRRLHADVPVGCFLSGGVDSAIVAAIAKKKLNFPVQAFSIGFDGWGGSEHEQAALYAKHLAVSHRIKLLNPGDLSSSHDIAALVDEPNADTSLLPTYKLCEFARQHVKVAISGDGADELFGGYGRYLTTLADFHARPETTQWGTEYYSSRILVFNEGEVKQVMGDLPDAARQHLAQLRSEVNASADDLITRLRKTDVAHYMPGAVLAKVDRMSMRNALEVRTPFLTREIARFAESLPLALVANPQVGKVLLKQLALRYYPKEWVYRPKQGFGIPPSDWGDQLYNEINDNVLSRCDQSNWWLDKASIKRWLQIYRANRDAQNYKFWCLLHLHHYISAHNIASDAVADPRPWLALGLRNWKVNSHVSVFCVTVPEICAASLFAGVSAVPLWSMNGYAGCDWLAHPEAGWSMLFTERRQFTRHDEVAFLDVSREDVYSLQAYLMQRGVKRIWLYEAGEWRMLVLGKMRKEDTAVFPLIFDQENQVYVNYTRASMARDFRSMLRASFGGAHAQLRQDRIVSASPETLFNRDTPLKAWQLLKEGKRAVRYELENRRNRRQLRQALAENFTRSPASANSKKIIFVLPNLSPGGAERQLCNLMIAFKQRGYDVKLFVLLALVGEGAHYEKMVRDEGIEIVVASEVAPGLDLAELCRLIPLSHLKVLTHQSYFIGSLLLPVFSHLVVENPMMVVNFLDLANLTGGIGALLAGVPAVVTSFRNVNPTHFSFYEKWYLPYYQELVRSPRLLLTGNSEGGNQSYAEWLGIPVAQIQLLRNGVDTRKYAPCSPATQRQLKATLGINEGDVVIGGVFRLSSEKRPALFVETIEALVKVNPATKGFILGGGGLRRDIEQVIADKKLTEHLKVIGPVDDVSPYLSISTVVLQTSDADGTANSLLEAQLMQIPVVATSAGGASESLIDGETGLLVADSRVENIVQAVLALLKDPLKRQEMGCRGKDFVECKYSMEVAATQLLSYASPDFSLAKE